MWPFKKPDPDTREPSEAAKAIAKSLETEPARWTICTTTRYLQHDSGITIDCDDNDFQAPWFGPTEPLANQAVIAEAVQKWIVARIALPVPEPLTEPANG